MTNDGGTNIRRQQRAERSQQSRMRLSSSSLSSDSDDREIERKRKCIAEEIDMKSCVPGFIENEDDPVQRKVQEESKKGKAKKSRKG